MNYRIFAVVTLLLAPLLAIMADSMSSRRHAAAAAPLPATALPPVRSYSPPSAPSPEPTPAPMPATGPAPAFGQPLPGAGEPMMPLGATNAQDAPDDLQNASR
jgi:hypothetical protein